MKRRKVICIFFQKNF